MTKALYGGCHIQSRLVWLYSGKSQLSQNHFLAIFKSTCLFTGAYMEPLL
jgi:hypothetical protein